MQLKFSCKLNSGCVSYEQEGKTPNSIPDKAVSKGSLMGGITGTDAAFWLSGTEWKWIETEVHPFWNETHHQSA